MNLIYWLRDKKKIFLFTIITIIILVNILRFFVAYDKTFNEDEFVHVHFGWLVKENEIPYKDFFYVHTPLFAYLTSNVIKVIGETVNVLFVMRILHYVLSLLLIYIIYKVVKNIYNKNIALLSILFLSFSMPFIEKIIEIRPEIWANLLFWSGLYFLVTAFKDGNNLKYALSGFLFGVGLLFMQKISVIMLPLSIPLIYNLVKDKNYIKKLLYFITPIAILLFIFLTFLIVNNVFGNFVFFSFTFFGILEKIWGLHPIYTYFLEYNKENLFLWILAAISLIYFTYKILKEKGFYKNILTLIIISQFIMLFVYIFLLVKFDGANAQAYLPFLPFISILAALLINKLAENITNETLKYSVILLFVLVAISPAFFKISSLMKENNSLQIDLISGFLENVNKEDRVYGGNGIVLFRKDTEPYFWYYSSLTKSAFDLAKKKYKEEIYLNETRLIILYKWISNTETLDLIGRAFLQIPLAGFDTLVYTPGKLIQIDKTTDTKFYIEYGGYYRLIFKGKEEDFKKISNILIDNKQITANEKILLSKGDHKLSVISEEMKETINIAIVYNTEYIEKRLFSKTL